MPSQPPAQWDFGSVRDLLNNLEHYDEQSTTVLLEPDGASVHNSEAATDKKGDGQTPHSLGNFSKIWQFLNIPHDAPPPVVPPPEDIPGNPPKAADILPSIPKEDVQAEELPGMTKAQKKRHRRKLRKAELEAAQLANKNDFEQTSGESDGPVSSWPDQDPRFMVPGHTFSSDSVEADLKMLMSFGTPAKDVNQNTIVQKSAQSEVPRYNLRSLAGRSAPTGPDEPSTPTPNAPTTISKRKQRQTSPTKELRALSTVSAPVPISKFPAVGTPIPNQDLSAFTASSSAPTATSGSYATAASNGHATAPSNSYAMAAISLVPSQVNVPRALGCQSLQPPQMVLSPNIFYPTTGTGYQISPQPMHSPQGPLGMKSPATPGRRLNVRFGTDRHELLFQKLLRDFPEDRRWLFSPMQLSSNQTLTHGIHLFVDASNILIGFNETLKRLQGLHPNTRTQMVDISFDSLVLLMERRRPAAKRVLVGSSPLLPAFEMAKAVGYEVSLLEKVFKVRELSERKKFFKNADMYGWNRAMAMRAGNDSDPETGTVEVTSSDPPVQRLVEQGVDEILHLKILESILDAEEPSTIVLATGDAAEAEYSSGFMAMVERALKRGWRVELVSWKQNISSLYRKREFRERWGEGFRIIELNEYAEELLNT